MFRRYRGLLPDSLLGQLKGFRTRLWLVRVAEALLFSLVNAAAAWLLIYISDRLWETPVWLIPVVFGLSLIGFLVFSPYWLVRWLAFKRTPLQLARLLETVMPALGDRLRGAIELAKERDSSSAMSPALRRAAINQVGDEMAGIDLKPAIRRRGLKGLTRIAFAVALLTVLIAMLTPEAAQNALERWLRPGNPPGRYTFTVLEPFASRVVVPLGETVTKDFHLASSSKTFPHTAQCRLGEGRWFDVPLAVTRQHDMSIQADDPSRGVERPFYRIDIPPLQGETSFRLKAGDADLRMTLVPLPRPALQRAVALIEPPGYIGKPLPSQPVRAGVVSALAGSNVVIHAVSTRELREVQMGEAPASEVRVERRTAIFPPVTSGPDPHEWNFSWTDRDGLTSYRPMSISIEPVADRQPVVHIRSRREERVILPDTSVEVELEATDDFGLMELGVEWIGEQNLSGGDARQAADAFPGTVGRHELVLGRGDRNETYLKSPFIFQANELGIKPQRVILRAFARDYFPGRERSYSRDVILHIMSPEEHAQYIRTQVERLAGSLEEVVREMDAMTDQSESLRKLDDAQLGSTETGRELQELADRETGNAERIRELRTQAESILKAAARNSQIDPEAMKNLIRAMEGMETASGQQIPSAAAAFRQAARGAAADRSNQLQQAEDEHKEAADALRRIGAELTRAAEKLEESTFAARLKFAARQETVIAKALSSRLGDVVGLKTDQYTSRQARNIRDIRTLQDSTVKVVGWILDELNQYRKREDVDPAYDELYQKMANAEIVAKLEQVSLGIGEAHIGISIGRASECARILAQWAELFEGVAPQSGGAGGEGDDDSLSDEDFEFVLKIMRMIQQQQDIRMRTRAVEEARRMERNQQEVTTP